MTSIVDVDAVREIFTVPAAGTDTHVDLRRLVTPSDDGAPVRALNLLVGRLYAKRLFVSLAKMGRFELAADVVESLRACARFLIGLPPEALFVVCRSPEITSWVYMAEAALPVADEAELELLVAHLGPMLLALAQAGTDVSALHRTIVPGAVATAEDCVSVLPIDLPRWGHRLRLVRGGAWYARYYPQDLTRRSSPLYFAISPEETDLFVRRLREAFALVEQAWPAAYGEMSASITAVAPLYKADFDPHNSSIHAFRGLIATSSRPTYLLAQTLVHETGHNKCSSILDLWDITREKADANLISPFVDQPRTPAGIVQGTFAFLVDAQITARLIGTVDELPGYDMLKYLRTQHGRIGEALSRLSAYPNLTEAGREIVAGFDDAYRALGHKL